MDQGPRPWVVERNEMPAKPRHRAPDIALQPQAMRLDLVQRAQGSGAKRYYEARRHELDLRTQVGAAVR